MSKALVFLLLLLSGSLLSAESSRNPVVLKPLDQQISIYQQAVRQTPTDPVAINRLAYSYIQKVRQTADQAYTVLAEKLLQNVLAIDPKNYDSLVYLSLNQMSEHRFADAKRTAGRAIAIRPSDSSAYGVFGDAAYEQGQYEECAVAYQKMMDLRPSTASYSRAAFYRRLVGDLDGATQLMKRALQLADVNDKETQSWCLLQLGHFAFAAGKLRDAQQLYAYSLELCPHYYNSVAAMAKVKAALGDDLSAIEFYQRAIAVVPMPDYVAALGDLYNAAGDREKAKDQYDLVEYIGLLGKINRQIYNRQLALFYADHNRKLDQALKLTEDELKIRKDIFGYDAYAWCLYKSGKTAAAKKMMMHALKMGTKDPLLIAHSKAILGR